MAEYAFDVVLRAALRVPNMPDEATARAELAAMLDAAYSNFGLWSNGEPILGEASIADDIAEPRLFEVDGVDVAPGSYCQPIGEVQYSMVWRDGSSLWHVQKNGIHFYETASFEDALQCCKDQDDFAGELSVKWPDMYVPHVAQPPADPVAVDVRAELTALRDAALAKVEATRTGWHRHAAEVDTLNRVLSALPVAEVDRMANHPLNIAARNPRHAEITLSLRAKADSDARDMAAIPSADDVARAVLVIDGNEELSDWVREFLNREDMRADDVDRVRGTCRAIMEEAELAIPSAEALKASRMNDAGDDMLAALVALLPEIDSEIEQRKHGGNVEAWAELENLSDAGHAAIRKAKGE